MDGERSSSLRSTTPSRTSLPHFLRKTTGPFQTRLLISSRKTWQARQQRLQDVVGVLRRASPDGVPEEDYRPLLRLLVDDMSARLPSQAIHEAFGIDSRVAYNDSMGVFLSEPPSTAELQRVEQGLRGAGWEPQN